MADGTKTINVIKVRCCECDKRGEVTRLTGGWYCAPDGWFTGEGESGLVCSVACAELVDDRCARRLP